MSVLSTNLSLGIIIIAFWWGDITAASPAEEDERSVLITSAERLFLRRR